MAQSLNTKVDLVMNGTSFLGINSYGKIMVGDKAFEYYNDRNVGDYIQIPWEEVDYVVASVMFKGKYIPRFAIQTKKAGTYSFAAKQPKKLLRAIRNYVPADRMRRSLSLPDVVKQNIQIIGRRISKKDKKNEE